MFRGEQLTLQGQVTKGGTPYPPTVTGFALTFTVKRKLGDAAPLIQRDSVADPADVTLNVGGSYSVAIKTADTSAFTVTELLDYDVILTEPDGTKTVVDNGTLKVARGAGT